MGASRPRKPRMYPYRPRPARSIICARCGVEFFHKGHGTPKYCPVCRPYVYEETQAKLRQRKKEKEREARGEP